MPQIEIRPANPKDIPVLMDIDHSYETKYVWQMEREFLQNDVRINFRETRLPRSVPVEYPNTIEILSKHNFEEAPILTALLNDVPVGYLRLKLQLHSRCVTVVDLAVSKSVRRQGIASGLVLAAQDWTSEKRIRHMVLEMQSKNHPAVRMALKLGFEFSGYNDHYYPSQDVALFFAKYIR
ncbi:MAG: GNAT family N-acetyltransferase [Anaerolineaceae bacterium]|nr:GNAT family N-acetyltransferase [Anaerolineaceae bacterium]